MAWSNLANLFCGSSHDFCQVYYNIKQIDFIFLCFCAVIHHRWRHSVWRTKSHALDCVSCVLFCSSHAMTSSVIYYSTDARKNEIYLLKTGSFTPKNRIRRFERILFLSFEVVKEPVSSCAVDCITYTDNVSLRWCGKIRFYGSLT